MDSDGSTPRPAWILIFPFSLHSGGLGAGSFCLLMADGPVSLCSTILPPLLGETEPGHGFVSSEREEMTASYTVTFRPETPRLVRTLCSYICWQFELVFMCWGGNQDKFIFIAAFPFPILQLFIHLTDITTPSSRTCALPRAAPREGLTFQNLL